MEIKIELGRDDRNVSVWVSTLNLSLRGKFKQAKAGGTAPGVPDLPGYVVACDSKGTVRYYDPLYGHARLPNIEKSIKQAMGKMPTVEAPVTLNIGENAAKRHIKCMYRLVEAGNAELREGRFPDWVVKEVEAERQKDCQAVGWTEQQLEESAETRLNKNVSTEILAT